MEGEHLYDEVCQAGDPAGYVARLDDTELRRLRGFCEHVLGRMPVRGGIPAVVDWLCKLDAAKRFF